MAEQFGILEEMYPGCIDLGLGHAPAPTTLARALRLPVNAAENFPSDIIELASEWSTALDVVAQVAP